MFNREAVSLTSENTHCQKSRGRLTHLGEAWTTHQPTPQGRGLPFGSVGWPPPATDAQPCTTLAGCTPAACRLEPSFW